jgi:hypothetical protein
MSRVPFGRGGGRAGSNQRDNDPLHTSTRPAGDAIDLVRRRDELQARVAELQWDLGGLVYEMVTRDQINISVIVRRAADLQAADAELHEAERILRLGESATAGECVSCRAPHSVGAVYCWQCGQPLLREVEPDAIRAP